MNQLEKRYIARPPAHTQSGITSSRRMDGVFSDSDEGWNRRGRFCARLNAPWVGDQGSQRCRAGGQPAEDCSDFCLKVPEILVAARAVGCDSDEPAKISESGTARYLTMERAQIISKVEPITGP
jgi:hypothetical protein